MQNKVLISIIVPIYNVECYLQKCVDSLINQTYPNIEIILVNDGSPDNCPKMCDSYLAKDERVVVIHKENGGLSDARNVAIDVAKGSYITFVDSDDYVSKNYVSVLYELITKYDADMAISLPVSFNEGDNYIISDTQKYSDRVYDKFDALSRMFYQKGFDTSAWAKIYQRSLFENVRYPKGVLFEDLATTYRLMLRANRVAFSTYRSYYYLIRKNSIEGSAFTPLKYESALTVLSIMEKDQKELSSIRKSYYCRIVSFLFHILLQAPSKSMYEKNLFLMVKKYRMMVLLDNNARIKTRIAILVSFFSLNLLRILFKYSPKS